MPKKNVFPTPNYCTQHPTAFYCQYRQKYTGNDYPPPATGTGGTNPIGEELRELDREIEELGAPRPQTVLDAIERLRGIGELEAAYDLSLALPQIADPTNLDHMTVLAQTFQLQGRLLQALERDFEADNAFSLATSLNINVGRALNIQR